MLLEVQWTALGSPLSALRFPLCGWRLFKKEKNDAGIEWIMQLQKLQLSEKKKTKKKKRMWWRWTSVCYWHCNRLVYRIEWNSTWVCVELLTALKTTTTKMATDGHDFHGRKHRLPATSTNGYRIKCDSVAGRNCVCRIGWNWNLIRRQRI